MADFWRVIWHIRLSEVVWPGGMDSVPTALEDSVLTAVERVAARHGIALDGSEESVAAIEFAIEEALLPIVDYLDWAEKLTVRPRRPERGSYLRGGFRGAVHWPRI